ncbi:MAG: hypothetical protein AB4040_03025 [Synechococcus sp.]
MTVSSQVKAETISGLSNSSRACFLLNIDVSAWFDQPLRSPEDQSQPSQYQQ